MTTTYEKCKTLRRFIVNRSAEVMNYTGWIDEFASMYIREIPSVILNKIGKVNVSELTSEQMDDLGFCLWSEENPIRLIPLWLYPFLIDEIEVYSIDGTSSVMKKEHIDTDNRFGCLAYGIFPAETRA